MPSRTSKLRFRPGKRGYRRSIESTARNDWMLWSKLRFALAAGKRRCRVARRCARGAGGATPGSVCRLADGLLSPEQARTALFLETILQQPCCPAWTVKLQQEATRALRPCYQELVAALPQQPELGMDETPHKEGPLKTWLWAFVAARFTVFALRLTARARCSRNCWATLLRAWSCATGRRCIGRWDVCNGVGRI